MLTNVAALVYDGVAPFELGVLCEAFGIDRREDGVPLLGFGVCGPVVGQVPTSVGFSIGVEHGLERLESADLIGVPAMPRGGVVPDEVVEALRVAHARGARILSVCSGAFTLGAAGLLDGRDCTTHWRYTEELQARYPAARVVPEVLYVDAGQVVTSAGTAAGLDACLHVWRQEYGAAVAGAVARRMVVPPHRDGGQAQFIARQVVDCQAETLGAVLTWASERLSEPLDVETLARQAHMSSRTFARRFRDETGTTPHSWITAQRLALAEEMLERTSNSVDEIAADTGFGNAATLRHHFSRARGVSPQAYRRQFSCVPAPVGEPSR